jgi:hypothetical protein
MGRLGFFDLGVFFPFFWLVVTVSLILVHVFVLGRFKLSLAGGLFPFCDSSTGSLVISLLFVLTDSSFLISPSMILGQLVCVCHWSP